MTLRVLLVADFYPPFIGGSEFQTQILAEGLARRGHTVTVVTVWHQGLKESETDRGVAVRRLRGLSMRLPLVYSDPARRRYHPPFPDPLIAFGLRRLIRQFRPDVVDATGWIAYSARLATAFSGVPLVLSARDFGYSCPIRTLVRRRQICSGPEFKKCLRHSAQGYGVAKGGASVLGVLGLRRWLIDGTAALHVLSTFMVDIERRDLTRGDDAQIVLVPDMIRPGGPAIPGDRLRTGSHRADDPPLPLNTDRVHLDGSYSVVAGEASEFLDRLPSEPYVLFVGALASHKGIDPLIAAYGRLNSAPPLVVVGSTWPDSPNEWPPGVTVLKDVPNTVVHQIWARSMFGVAPSLLPETFGGVVTEAMQHGRPIVASSIGGPLDTVLDGRTGFLVPPGDVDALAGAMQALIDDPGLRRQMGSLAREEVQRFGTEVVIPQFEQLYAQVAASRSGGT